jgi:hypothetical protein
MAVDRRSALKREEPAYTRYAGPKLQHVREPEPDSEASSPSDPLASGAVETAAYRAGENAGGGIIVLPRARVEAPPNALSHEFIGM